MSPWFYIGFPLAMMIAPMLAIVAWCLLTGVRGVMPILLATLVALVGFGISASVTDPARPVHYTLWGTGVFFVLFFVFGLPITVNAFRSLPETPRGAALTTRRLEMFRGAFVWPYVAWALVTASLFLADVPGIVWICPAVGLVGLLVLKRGLQASMREPEPLGGADPDGMAERWAAFRRRRVLFLYWMSVVLSLLATSGWLLGLGDRPAMWIGATVGPLIGLAGGAFGVWADAQRYNLRRQLAGIEPL